ncbi:MAG: alpha/beta hydrolase [Pseudomonadota bacterium]
MPQPTLPLNASPDLDQLHAAFEAPLAALGGLPVRLRCNDGRELSAHWFEPGARHTPARAVAVVSTATGVPQGFYRGFAQWLAGRGYAVLTYDYRGIGASRRGPIGAETAAMRDWGRLDMSAALAEAERRRNKADGDRLPLLLVGHSFGGSGLGLAHAVGKADAILTVASQLADWRLWPQPQRWLTAFFCYALLPGATHLFGHAPGWALGGGSAQPLPRRVALEWARWTRGRGFLYGDPGLQADLSLHRFTGTAHLWSVSDDLTYAPPRAVDGLAAMFVNARAARHTLTPAEVGQGRLGHFGAFRRQSGARVWPHLLAPIEAATPALRKAGLAPL